MVQYSDVDYNKLLLPQMFKNKNNAAMQPSADWSKTMFVVVCDDRGGYIIWTTAIKIWGKDNVSETVRPKDL